MGGIGVAHVAPVAAAALEEREVPFESERCRPRLRLLAEVPFARHVGVVAVVAQHAGDGGHPIIEVTLVARLPVLRGSGVLVHVAEPGDVMIHSGQQHRACRRARRRSAEARGA